MTKRGNYHPSEYRNRAPEEDEIEVYQMEESLEPFVEEEDALEEEEEAEIAEAAPDPASDEDEETLKRERELREVRRNERRLRRERRHQKAQIPTAKQARDLLVKIGAITVILWLILTFVIGVHVCHDNSMYPSIRYGDLDITYKLVPYQRGDTVVYVEDGQKHFGRIVGMPGDVVEITESGLKVNGEIPTEDIFYETTADGAMVAFPHTVSEDAYFILNDYRLNVYDSRTYGDISKQQLRGSSELLLRRRGY